VLFVQTFCSRLCIEFVQSVIGPAVVFYPPGLLMLCHALRKDWPQRSRNKMATYSLTYSAPLPTVTYTPRAR
jgi:small neutral amino acid transporter SnatA (MarC family)